MGPLWSSGCLYSGMSLGPLIQFIRLYWLRFALGSGSHTYFFSIILFIVFTNKTLSVLTRLQEAGSSNRLFAFNHISNIVQPCPTINTLTASQQPHQRLR